MRIRCGTGIDGLVESVGGDVGRALVGKGVKSIEEASIQFAAQNCYVVYSRLLHDIDVPKQFSFFAHSPSCLLCSDP